MNQAGVIRAADLRAIPAGTYIRIAGAVIVRQRPGTASGFIFLSNEDETGISRAIVRPKLYDRNRVVVTREQFLMVEGILQNQDGGISVKASTVRALELSDIDIQSHDFH
jgi:error-prone DNA polymerase